MTLSSLRRRLASSCGRSTRKRPRVRRDGVTLVELLITLVVLGIVGGTLITAIIRQQRVNARTVAMVDVRSQGRLTVGTLLSELRGVSPVSGDIIDMTSTSLRFRGTIGASVICWIDAGRTRFRVPPMVPLGVGAPEGGQVLTGFLDVNSLPAIGDDAWVFDVSQPPGANSWARLGLADATVTASGAAGCPFGVAGALLTALDAANPSFEMRVGGALPPGVVVGAPVRFTREVRYRFFEAADGFWYLGYELCAPACGAIQPVTGPFAPATGVPATTGFRFAYHDVNGNITANPLEVSRIEIVTRARSRDAVSSGAGARSVFVHTDSVSVALRNRT